MKLGQSKEAIADAEKAVKLSKSSIQALDVLGKELLFFIKVIIEKRIKQKNEGQRRGAHRNIEGGFSRP